MSDFCCDCGNTIDSCGCLTIYQWCERKGIQMLDPDGFDRADPLMWERTYTEQEFDKRLIYCTVQCVAPDIETILRKEVERLNQEIEQLRDMLRKCSPFGLIPHPEARCNFCGVDDESHTDDCEYVRLTKEGK